MRDVDEQKVREEMATYQAALPSVFPHKLLLPRATVKELVNQLLDSSHDLLDNGSSFAVTVDVYFHPFQRYQWLWLSEASYAYLRAMEPDLMSQVAPVE